MIAWSNVLTFYLNQFELFYFAMGLDGGAVTENIIFSNNVRNIHGNISIKYKVISTYLCRIYDVLVYNYFEI